MAIQRWPENALSYDILGWAQASMAKKEEAKASFEKALQLDPTLDDAKQNLLNLGSLSSSH
jgi:tetratricopeptide (TPR) repeat protein